MQKLSSRLQLVADYVPAHARLADIGSDHAKLPIFLVKNGRIDFAIAGEVAKGPYQMTQEHIQDFPQINARLADGLAAIESSDKIDTVVIAGMGGILISDILEAGKTKLGSVKRLILQPNREEAEVRHWLSMNMFKIVSEKILEDHRKIYEIIVAEPGNQILTAEPGNQILTAEQENFGIFLSDEAIFRKKWKQKIEKLDKVLSFLPESKQEEREKIIAERSQIEGILNENF